MKPKRGPFEEFLQPEILQRMSSFLPASALLPLVAAAADNAPLLPSRAASASARRPMSDSSRSPFLPGRAIRAVYILFLEDRRQLTSARPACCIWMAAKSPHRWEETSQKRPFRPWVRFSSAAFFHTLLCGRGPMLMANERTKSERKRILVVDDDPGIRAVLSEFLQGRKYTVATAANGEEAMHTLRHGERPDLIVLDLLMPVMSGWEFLDATARDPSISDIPIIIITAHEHNRVQLKGVVDVFMKSNDLKALGDSIDRAVG